MLITLNGDRHEVPESTTLSDLLATLDMQNRRFAVEINEQLIPRSEHATRPLHSDDQVEIVQAIGGG
jgi:sulfur carrier protein